MVLTDYASLCALSGVPRLWACGGLDEVKPADAGARLTGQCDVKLRKAWVAPQGLGVSSTQRCDECCKDPPSPRLSSFGNVRYPGPKQSDGRD